MSEYIPCGEEWTKTVMRMKKEHIVKMFREVCLERDELRVQSEQLKASVAKLESQLEENHARAEEIILARENEIKRLRLESQQSLNAIKAAKFKVTVKNEVLGDSEQIMTLSELESFNVGAYWLANKSMETGKAESDGVWFVSVIPNEEQLRNDEVE